MAESSSNWCKLSHPWSWCDFLLPEPGWPFRSNPCREPWKIRSSWKVTTPGTQAAQPQYLYIPGVQDDRSRRRAKPSSPGSRPFEWIHQEMEPFRTSKFPGSSWNPSLARWEKDQPPTFSTWRSLEGAKCQKKQQTHRDGDWNNPFFLFEIGNYLAPLKVQHQNCKSLTGNGELQSLEVPEISLDCIGKRHKWAVIKNPFFFGGMKYYPSYLYIHIYIYIYFW